MVASVLRGRNLGSCISGDGGIDRYTPDGLLVRARPITLILILLFRSITCQPAAPSSCRFQPLNGRPYQEAITSSIGPSYPFHVRAPRRRHFHDTGRSTGSDQTDQTNQQVRSDQSIILSGLALCTLTGGWVDLCTFAWVFKSRLSALLFSSPYCSSALWLLSRTKAIQQDSIQAMSHITATLAMTRPALTRCVPTFPRPDARRVRKVDCSAAK